MCQCKFCSHFSCTLWLRNKSHSENENSFAAKSTTIQCKGITKKGERCKLNTTDGFCHYHSPLKKNNLVPPISHSPSRSPSPTKTKPGFIYVYTLTSLLNGTNNSLSVQNLPGTKRDKWSAFDARKLKYMFIKVGMTTGTVLGRLSQWERQCNHKLTCLVPGAKIKKSLVESFRNLSLSRPSYKTFKRQSDGFWCSKSVQQAETQIHTLLHQKYGRGNMRCLGCAKSGSHYSIHVEWFLVPKTDLASVFSVIDSVCRWYN